MLKIGFLLPRSTLFPSFGLDILSGFQIHLQELGIKDQVTILTDNIGFGISEQEVYTKAENFVLQHEADIVVVVCDYRNTEILQPLFLASNKILLVLNCGTDLVNVDLQNTTTILHSLNFAFCARLTGKLAFDQGNKSVVHALSYYDSGYFQSFSMINAYHEKGGISDLYCITKLKLDEFSLEPIEQMLQYKKVPATLLCIFNGEQARKFYEHIQPIHKQHSIACYITPMMLTEEFNIENKELNTIGYTPYITSAENLANNQFKNALNNKQKKQNYFNLLGWDAATLVQQIYYMKQNGAMNAVEIINEIKNTTMQSPRGWLKLDAATHSTYGPIYLKQGSQNGWKYVDQHKDVFNAYVEFVNVQIDVTQSSSWKNTYLCI